jgi:hypothetical protein
MSADAFFSTANLVAGLAWLLLIIAGRMHRVADLITGAVIPLLLSLLYAVLIVTVWPTAEGGFSSIGEVRALFANDWLLVAGWVHYLAFDLFIGSWQVRDARRHGIPHVALIPGLILTFLFGPIGLLVYTAIRLWRTRSLATTA